MRKERGFTLIELLIVVAIIGIIAAIAIPNLLNAVQRGKQKRSMGDMRTTATAIEAYAVDNNIYPNSGSPAALTAISNIAPTIEPIYIKSTPRKDGWNNPMYYAMDAALQEYTLVSYGKNKVAEGNPLDAAPGTQTKKFGNDIVYSTGSFIQWPEGRQEN